MSSPHPTYKALAEGRQLSRVPLYTPLPHFPPPEVLHYQLRGSLGRFYLPTTAAARATLPIPTSACSISVCQNDGTAASVWDF